MWNCPKSSCHGAFLDTANPLESSHVKNSPFLGGTREIVLLSSQVWKNVNGWALEIGISCTYSNPVVTGGRKHTHTVDEEKPPSAKANNDSDDNKAVNIRDSSWVQDLIVDECQMINVPSTFGVYSIAEAWEWINSLNREVKNNNGLSCHLYCGHCCHGENLIVMVENCTNIVLGFPKIGMVLSSLLDEQL